jgi:hypothetical protein
LTRAMPKHMAIDQAIAQAAMLSTLLLWSYQYA